MKHIFPVLLALLLLAVIWNCSSDPSGSDPKPNPIPPELSTIDKTVLGKSNAFGYELFQRINEANQGANLFISPLSVSIAFGMAYNGAGGSTRDSIQEVLGLDGMDISEVNQSYKTLMEYILALDPKVIMEIANSNWLKEGADYKEEFISLNREYFDAEVREVDFNDYQPTLNLINGWVADKTHNKIDHILDSIDPLTYLILINAIYFKGTWTYQFDEDKTEEMMFYPETDSEYMTPFMIQKTDLKYYTNDNFSSVDLPYGDGKYVMTLFLPDEDYSADAFINDFTEENFTGWLENYHEDEVNLFLPKFEMECEYTLNDILIAMGMAIAFDPDNADFSNITDFNDLYITSVIHKTFVKVNEEGTEAAAVTAITIGVTSVEPEIFMVLNKPFVFVIRDVETNGLLFMGKVMKP